MKLPQVHYPSGILSEHVKGRGPAIPHLALNSIVIM